MTILEKLITLHKITKKDLALQLEITTGTLNKRLKGISEWRIQDIHNIADILRLMPWHSFDKFCPRFCRYFLDHNHFLQ